MLRWPNSIAPKPVKGAVVHTRHGVDYPDPYAWMRDDNWQQVVRDPAQLSPEIRDHLLAENQYAAEMLADTSQLQTELVQEMKGRMLDTKSDVPAKDGNWFYNTRYQTGAEHPLFVRYPVGDDGEPELTQEQVLLDAAALANGKAFFQLGSVCHSPDHSQIAWSVDEQGSEFFQIFVRELTSGKTTNTGIVTAGSELIWSADSQSLFWVWRDAKSRPKQVRQHIIGSDPATDQVLYQEADDGFFLGLDQTSDHTYALIQCNDHETSEIWVIDLASTNPTPTCLWPRQLGIEVDAEHRQGQFTLLSNANQATDFQIIRGSITEIAAGSAQILVPHKPGVLILGQQQFADFHVRLERESALPRIVIRNERDDSEHIIRFEEAAYALGLAGGYEFDTPFLRFAVSSPARPRRIFAYQMQSRERSLLQQQEIPSGHDPAQYQVRRLLAPAKDGQMVPITILSRADCKLDGTNPLLLYGYGAYGHSLAAGFSSHRLSLVDRGM
ncbi:Protease II, partial [hydrothermal vent metagenome]